MRGADSDAAGVVLAVLASLLSAEVPEFWPTSHLVVISRSWFS